jgi:hypothetical protein
MSNEDNEAIHVVVDQPLQENNHHGINKIVEDWCTLVSFSLVLP